MLQDFHPAVVAFFDLDRTLIGKSSGELYIRTLKRQGRVSHWTLAKILTATALYSLKLLSPEWLMDRAASWYEGESEQEMITFCRDFFHDTVSNYLYEEAIQRVLVERKKARAVDDHIQDLVRRADISNNEKWVKDQYALAMDNPVDKARMSGKPTMAEFGATGCIPCDMMQPILDKLRKNYPDTLNVIFAHVREKPIMGARFGIRSIPVQVFFDRDGKEVFRHVGFFPEAEVTKQLKAMGVQ